MPRKRKTDSKPEPVDTPTAPIVNVLAGRAPRPAGLPNPLRVAPEHAPTRAEMLAELRARMAQQS